ncbi:MAG: hypothetical protein J0I20_36160 [Chloroflexi bacterium]|nr:hypothetical protein [Chloroflexota bacterium]OJW06829.1 MAG: hypothetical protein BGO39_23850 [Chloroflexi bacterium 54-19]
MDLKQVAEDIPEYSTFLTIEELAASTHQLKTDFPHMVSTKVVGHSQSGFPIELISIGSGPKSALVVGTPHPNEPIGTMTIEFLTRYLCENPDFLEETGYTWHFIKTIDPDGLKLNEGWLKGPFTLNNYLTHFFREAFRDQAEYSFPADYKILKFDKPTPQTLAWKTALDLVKPDFLYSLHNSEMGGVFYLITSEASPLKETFAELPEWAGLALDPVGEPGVCDNSFGPSISPMISITKIIDELEVGGVTDPTPFWGGGYSSSEYALRYGSFSLVVEMPYWDNKQFLDESPTGQSYHALLREFLATEEEFMGWLQPKIEVVRPFIDGETNLWLHAIDEQLGGATRRKAGLGKALEKPEDDRPATQADVFTYNGVMRLFRQRPLTMFKRMLEIEQAHGNCHPEFGPLHEAASARLAEVCDELENTLSYRNIPIRDLVMVQACAGLATAAFVKGRN